MAKGAPPPRDPVSAEVKAVWKQLDEGDVLGARKTAQQLLAGAPSEQDQAELQELLSRSQTPRALYGYAALAATLIALLVALAAARY